MRRARRTRAPLAALAAALLVVAAGCLEVPGPPTFEEPMCSVDSDCDTARGEVCGDGICWGDPPEGRQFGALLVPPSDRVDLVPTEVPLLHIGASGQISGLDFASPITLSGRVVIACDTETAGACDNNLSVAAQIQVRREARIPGGPAYTRTFTAHGGVGSGGIGFTVRLPPTTSSENPYQVTVTPDDGSLSSRTDGETPAQLVPPRRFSLEVYEDSAGLEWVLGDAKKLRVIKGRVVDAANRGLAGMQVWALGRWNVLTLPERASSIGTTDAEGWFKIRVPQDIFDVVELVVKPSPGTQAPTLRKAGVLLPTPAPGEEYVLVDDLRMPSFADPVTFVVPVQSRAGDGGTIPVIGAEVQLRTVLLDEGGTVASFTATGFTDNAGEARLPLIPGGGQQNRLYLARIIPPASSEASSLFDHSISVGLSNPNGASYLAAVVLDRRVPVGGRVVTHDGIPVAGATVSARVSPALKLSLDSASQSALEHLQLPAITADASGGFLLWLDRNLIGYDARYDVDLVPPEGSRAPRWSVAGVQPPKSGESVDLGVLTLPEASYARGPVRDPSGAAIPEAEVRVYELSSDEDLCAALPNDGDGCRPPAILRGLWRARPSGEVWIALPHPR